MGLKTNKKVIYELKAKEPSLRVLELKLLAIGICNTIYNF